MGQHKQETLDLPPARAIQHTHTGLARGRRYAYVIVDSVESASQDGSTNLPLEPRDLGPNPYRGTFTVCLCGCPCFFVCPGAMQPSTALCVLLRAGQLCVY